MIYWHGEACFFTMLLLVNEKNVFVIFLSNNFV